VSDLTAEQTIELQALQLVRLRAEDKRTNKEIAKGITERLIDRHIIKSKGRDMPQLRSHVEREIEYALLSLRINPWDVDA
jgi:hypothetical protein